MKEESPIHAREAFLTARGIHSLYPFQQEALTAWENGRDMLITLPTGRGKSLCYQLPALGIPGLTIVISPLVALMQDQVTQLKKAGVAAEYLCSLQDDHEQQGILHSLAHLSLIYVTPERLRSPSFLAALEGIRINAIVIDEAHCVSLWGQTFRPSYRRIRHFLLRYPAARRIALSATITPPVQKDIEHQLCLRQPVRIATSVLRGDITMHLSAREHWFPAVVRLLQTSPCGIIYVQSRYECERLGFMLSRHFPVAIYHAGLEKTEREKTLMRFLSGEISWVVATSAFGMGIDKPDIRTIVHIDPPPSIEDYLQQIGRASRDGRGGHAYLFLRPSFLLSPRPRHTLTPAVIIAALWRGQWHLLQRYLYENRLWSTMVQWIGYGLDPVFVESYFSRQIPHPRGWGIPFQTLVALLQGRHEGWLLSPQYGTKRGLPQHTYLRWLWSMITSKRLRGVVRHQTLWIFPEGSHE